MIDLLFITIFGIATYRIAKGGAVGAGMSLLGMIFSGLLAMNFFEPLANGLEQQFGGSGAIDRFWDLLCLLGLAILFGLIFRIVVKRLGPSEIPLLPWVNQIGQWLFAAATGYLFMGFLALSLHVGPFPRDIWGYFPPEPERRSGPISAMGPDYHWLGFTQYVSEHVFRPAHRDEIFDAPSYQAGQQTGVWSSFPIRYATRRAEWFPSTESNDTK